MTPRPPASLVRHLREKRCMLFCGSGLSAAAGLPTWKRLLEEIVKELATDAPEDPSLVELDRLLAAGKLLEIADHCKEALGQRYNEILSERLRGATGEIPAPHQVIIQLPFAGVVTTNYDKLLERSYAGGGSWPKTPTHLDVDTLGPLLFDGSFFILKAHGDIDKPESMVLTTRDYQAIIHANPAFNAIFSAILLTRAVLFIGYSLNDPDFRLLLDRQLTVFRGNIPERYALMSGVGKVECDVLWRTAKIKVLSYDEGQHGQVLEFLRALLAEVKPASITPAPTPGPTPAPSPPPIAAPAPAAVTTRQRSAPVPPQPIQPPLAPPQVERSEASYAPSEPEAGEAGRQRPRSAPASPPSSDRKRGVPAGPGAAGKVAGPGLALSIRLQGSSLEARLSGRGETIRGTGGTFEWSYFMRMMRDALSHQAKARVFARELSARLPPTVLSALAEIPAHQTITLHLSADIELFPWEWILVGDQYLVLRHPLVRAPLGVSDTARGYPTLHTPLRVLLIGDAATDLPGARNEILQIQKTYLRHPDVVPRCLLGLDASYDNVANELTSAGYDIVHFAGHAWFDDTEPFLLLADSVKLSSTEMRSLLSPHPPAILFLNSHYTIFTPPGASREKTHGSSTSSHPQVQRGQRGFMEASSIAGVGALIGTFCDSLLDKIALHVGVQFHENLLSGRPAADALHGALLSADLGKENTTSHHSYALSGYGDLALPWRAAHPARGQRWASAGDQGE